MNERAPGILPPNTETADRLTLKLVLLPGMDGTGELFAGLVEALPDWIHPEVVAYPRREHLSVADLLLTVRSALPESEPFAILAESFSTSIAIRLAAEAPPNLKALIVCAGFIESPIRTPLRFFLSLLAPILLRFPLPAFAIKALLVGKDASIGLIQSTRATISSVSPAVLLGRLREILMCDEAARLAMVAAPILYIRANQDALVGPECLDAIRRVKPSVTVAQIDGPHFILQRKPTAVVEALTAFLESNSVVAAG
jgi:pimeloyl-[acyl-carrier protein] methyl ester esterase